MKKKFDFTAILLLVILTIRCISQIIIVLFLSDSAVSAVIFSIFSVVYFIALTGIFMRQKWGLILVMLVAAIDIAFALINGGAEGFGAGVVDLILLFLGYIEYERFSSRTIR